ncbi:MAG: DUF3103 domain-containing protein [Treponema sp.]|nr:DUF3103 domain-containing protein [Treponema sp.]
MFCGILLSIILVSCSHEVSENSDANPNVEHDFKQLSSSLPKLARTITEVFAEDTGYLDAIVDVAMKQFDGDYDALYTDVKDLYGSEVKSARFVHPITFENALKKKMKKNDRQAVEEINNLLDIPELNFYVYSPDYSVKNEAGAFLIAAMDYSVDDNDLEYILAYDFDGNEYKMDAWELPDVPVIVLGLNERTNHINGDMDFFEENNRAANFDGNSFHREILKSIKWLSPYGKWDPWPCGYPELYIVYNFMNQGSKQYYDNVDKKGKTYKFDTVQFSISNHPANVIWGIFLYDEDSGYAKERTVETTQEVNGVKQTIKTTIPAHDTDDFMGSTTISYYHNTPETVIINGVAEITLSY